MARITFGQITLEDPNKSLQDLVQIYKGLFINDEFALPLISNVSDIEDLDEDIDDIEEDDNGSAEPIVNNSGMQWFIFLIFYLFQ